MVAVPTGLPVGIAAGRFLFVSQDQADAGTTPDFTVISGTIKFVCSSKVPLQVASQSLVMIPLEFQAEFDSEGYVRPLGAPDGQRGVELPASSSDVYNPKGFTWRMEFNIRSIETGKTIKVDPIPLFIQEGVTNQIADQMPLGESKGVVQIRGERGISLTNVTTNAPGKLVFAFNDNTTKTVDINDAVMAAFQSAAKPSGIGIDTDGVPYISPLANEAYIMYDTDGVPYFV